MDARARLTRRVRAQGPFWKRIRGQGYAYSFGVAFDVERGVATFNLYRATNVSGALSEAVACVRSFADADAFSQLEFEAAVSSTVHEVVELQKNVDRACEQAYVGVRARACVCALG